MISLKLSRSAKARYTARQRQRVSLCLPAELLSLQGERSALVVNLCTHGAQLEIPLPPEPGSEVILFCGGIEAEGLVAWTSGQHCGISFHHPIKEAEIDCEANWSRVALIDLLSR